MIPFRALIAGEVEMKKKTNKREMGSTPTVPVYVLFSSRFPPQIN